MQLWACVDGVNVLGNWWMVGWVWTLDRHTIQINYFVGTCHVHVQDVHEDYHYLDGVRDEGKFVGDENRETPEINEVN